MVYNEDKRENVPSTEAKEVQVTPGPAGEVDRIIQETREWSKSEEERMNRRPPLKERDNQEETAEQRLKQLSPEIQHRYKFLAGLAPYPATFELEDTANVWNIGEQEARETFDVLWQNGLVEIIADEKDRYAMQPEMIQLSWASRRWGRK